MIFILHMNIAFVMRFLISINDYQDHRQGKGIDIGAMSEIDIIEQLVSTFLLQWSPKESFQWLKGPPFCTGQLKTTVDHSICVIPNGKPEMYWHLGVLGNPG